MVNDTTLQKSQVKSQVSYGQLIAFFLPLALSAMLMMSSHSIISSAMARTAEAEIAIAAFAVASSISMMFESPCYHVRRMATALFDDQTSLKSIFVVGAGVIATSISIMAVIAFTGLGKIVFINMVGINPELFPEVIKAFKLFMLLPLISGIRGYFQGMLIVRKKTFWLTINVSIRLVVMILLTNLLLGIESLSGGMVGSILLVCGIGTEALLALITALFYKKDFPNKPTRDCSITIRDALIFYIPLIGAIFVQTFSRPGINAGLARVSNPEAALASYQVAHSFAMIFIVLLYSVHQIVLVFVKDKKSLKKVALFSSLLSIVMAFILFLCGVTPLGKWALHSIIGVEQSMAIMAARVVGWYSIMPLVLCGVEIFTGLLMLNKRTPTITVAKIGSIIGIVGTATVLSMIAPNFGGSIGALAMTSGAFIELLIVFFRSRSLISLF
ncbi:hypothetical protein IMX26_05350 [Clostridium sp. 'deep sea']|uniref:hypothetical protein n=1 Tax=Clostridium sp. 'deep sea' TaxID=2779445 RepID=UPI0018969D87|nr:hypothetical protein [Clostridium sp. 'deep sea']QOR36239.1 hypothetical protein IMX26_05350 [Clostridium sp. 'deep sea']